jgi:signal transduction histidine kinase
VLRPIANERYLEYASDVHDAGHHLLTIVNDVLDISKAEPDRLNLNMQIVDVAQTVRGRVRMMAEQLRAGGVRLSVNMPDDFP